MNSIYQKTSITQFTTSKIKENNITTFAIRNDIFALLTKGNYSPDRKVFYPNSQCLGLDLLHEEGKRVKIGLSEQGQLVVLQYKNVPLEGGLGNDYQTIHLDATQSSMLENLLSMFYSEWCAFLTTCISPNSLNTGNDYSPTSDFSYAFNLCNLYLVYQSVKDSSQQDEEDIQNAELIVMGLQLRGLSALSMFQILAHSIDFLKFRFNLTKDEELQKFIVSVYKYDQVETQYSYLTMTRVRISEYMSTCRLGCAPFIPRTNRVQYDAN